MKLKTCNMKHKNLNPKIYQKGILIAPAELFLKSEGVKKIF